MRGIFGINPAWGVTAVRVMTGLLFAVHGYQKFARGLGDVSAYFAKISIPFSGLMAPFIASLDVGFVWNLPAENGRALFRFDTGRPGNGNGGHEGPTYGTDLTPEQKQVLLEYLKTF